MDNFFDQFKENLENQSPPPFDGKDWEDMQERLSNKQHFSQRYRMQQVIITGHGQVVLQLFW